MNDEKVQEIYVEDIIPNRFQPRLTFDEKALKELADSIKIHGVIQPLVLRRVGNKYEIIAGERRYKAACMAGLKKVPAIVRDMTDNESAEVALIENVQRKNLSSIEEAKSYKNLLDRGYLTQEELAKKLGVTQGTIANKLRLLNLCDEVQNALLNEQISERHARSLLQLENPDDQKMMLNRVIKERLTVRQLDNEIKKFLNKSDNENEGNGESKTMMNNNETNNEINNNAVTEQTQTETPAYPNQTKVPEGVETNIFGMPITKPVDFEAKAPNLDTGVDESVPPAAFNPFASPEPTNNQVQVNNPETNQAPESNLNQQNQNPEPQPNPQTNMFNQNEAPQSNNQNTGNIFFNMPIDNQNTEASNNQTNAPSEVQEQVNQNPPVQNNAPTINPFANANVNVDTTASVVKPEEKLETFNMFGDVVNPEDIMKQKQEEKEEEVNKKNNFGKQINNVRDVIHNIENEGFEVESEEYDFEDMYQIVIKIKKNNA